MASPFCSLRMLTKNKQVLNYWLLRVMSSMAGGNHLQRTATKTRSESIAKADVKDVQDKSSTVKLLKLHIPDQQFTFKAGQWVDMFIPGLQTVGGFSMSSPPHLLKQSGILHLAIKYSRHPPALWVHTKCQVGSHVHLRVGGDFYYDPTTESEPRDLLLLAGGVGINPLYSMLQHFVYCQKDEKPNIKNRSACMLYSAKSEEELIFRDELLKLKETSQNVNLRLFSSRDKSTSSAISNGRIQSSDIQSALKTMDASKTDVFLCGPLPFLQEMKTLCIASNIPPEKVFFESWS